jgi:hypothetical protein
MLRRTLAVLAVTLCAAPALAQSAAEIEKVKEEIWAKERAIYEGRAKGGLTFYLENTAPTYLGWPPSAARPMALPGLRQDAQRLAGQNKEKLTMELTGFTMQGDTAVIYYLNHRTMRPDGSTTDEKFENIHVWTRIGSDWRLIGAMSRLEPPRKSN